MRLARPIAVSLLLAACQAGVPKAIDTAATKAAIDTAVTRAAIEATSANFSRWIQAGQLDSAATILAEDTFNMPPNHAAIAGRAQWLAWAKSTLTAGTMSSAPVAESRHYGDSLCGTGAICKHVRSGAHSAEDDSRHQRHGEVCMGLEANA
jgi:ketosteroid isomerase-like protein